MPTSYFIPRKPHLLEILSSLFWLNAPSRDGVRTLGLGSGINHIDRIAKRDAVTRILHAAPCTVTYVQKK
jgi:hypothetical protein